MRLPSRYGFFRVGLEHIAQHREVVGGSLLNGLGPREFEQVLRGAVRRKNGLDTFLGNGMDTLHLGNTYGRAKLLIIIVVVPCPDEEFHKVAWTVNEVSVEQPLETGWCLPQSIRVAQCSGFDFQNLEIVLDIKAVVIGHKAALVAGNLFLGGCICVVDDYIITILLYPDIAMDVLERDGVAYGVKAYGSQFIHTPEVCLKAGHLAAGWEHDVEFFLDEVFDKGIILKANAQQVLVGLVQAVKMVPMTERPAAEYLYSPFNVSFLVAGLDIAELMFEAIIPFKLGEFNGGLLVATREALDRCPHIVVYHKLWHMAPEREGLDVSFHHGLFVLMAEQAAPAAIAAKRCGGHVESGQSAFDVDLDLAPVELHSFAGNILLLDIAVLDGSKFTGLLLPNVPGNAPVGDIVSGFKESRMDVCRLLLLLPHAGGHLDGIVFKLLVNKGLDLVCKNRAVHLPVFVLWDGTEQLCQGLGVVSVGLCGIVQLAEPDNCRAAHASVTGNLAIAKIALKVSKDVVSVHVVNHLLGCYGPES